MKLQKPKGSQVFRSFLASIAIALVLLAGGLLAIQQMGAASNPDTREGYNRDSILVLNTSSDGIRVNGGQSPDSWE